MATRTAASPSALSYDIPVLTDRQRAKVRDYYAEHPDGGYKYALQYAGIRVTRAVAKAAILADDEVCDVARKALGVDSESALKRIGELMRQDENLTVALRAATWVSGAFDGLNEKTAVELSSAPDAPLTIVIESAFPPQEDDEHNASPSALPGEPETS